MEYEISYPLYVVLFSVFLFVVMLVINKAKHFDKKLFLMPLLFFISAVITFIVGYFTPCVYCTL
jgi:peptidoglycan/LPS O-acetylase OafA/YrhL